MASFRSFVLHILDGEATGPFLDGAGIGGARVVFGEMLSAGPVPGGLATPDDWRRRESLVRDALEPRYRAPDLAWIDGCAKEDELVLWFDTDLFCEVNLAYLATRLPEGPHLARVVGAHRRRAPDDVRIAFSARYPLARELHRRAWSAYASADPRGLVDVARELPAFLYHLDEFPGARDGLSGLERRMLRTIADGAPMDERALHARVGAGGYAMARGLTDTDIARTLRELRRAPALLDERGLTSAGRDVLEGRADAVRLRGIDRWLGGVHIARAPDGAEAMWTSREGPNGPDPHSGRGGVHLAGQGPVWRWNGSALSLA